MISIRSATDSDAPALTDIYNHYVVNTHITFDLEPVDVANRLQWMAQYKKECKNERHQLLVAELEGKVIGYACSGSLRTKPAYQRSVETTIYLEHSAGGRGFGKKLYGELLNRLAATDVHRCYGVIALPNEGSVRLHESLGFKPVGQLHEVGYKFDQYWDTLWLEKALK